MPRPRLPTMPAGIGTARRRRFGVGAMSRYPLFDRASLRVRPLAERQHLLRLPDFLAPLDAPPPLGDHPDLVTVAERIVAARAAGRPVVLAMGAHVLRAGVGPHLIE